GLFVQSSIALAFFTLLSFLTYQLSFDFGAQRYVLFLFLQLFFKQFLTFFYNLLNRTKNNPYLHSVNPKLLSSLSPFLSTLSCVNPSKAGCKDMYSFSFNKPF